MTFLVSQETTSPLRGGYKEKTDRQTSCVDFWLLDPNDKSIKKIELQRSSRLEVRKHHRKTLDINLGMFNLPGNDSDDGLYEMWLEQMPMMEYYPASAKTIGCKVVGEEHFNGFSVIVDDWVDGDSREGCGFHIAGKKVRYVGRAIVVGALGIDEVKNLVTWVEHVNLNEEPKWQIDPTCNARGDTKWQESYIKECYMCKRTGKLLTCKRCQSIRYCSKECQTTDWPRHRPVCKR